MNVSHFFDSRREGSKCYGWRGICRVGFKAEHTIGLTLATCSGGSMVELGKWANTESGPRLDFFLIK